MARKPVLRTWDQVAVALEENGVPQRHLGTYYGRVKQETHIILKRSRGLALPDSDGIWQAIEDIKRGVLVEPEAE